MTGRSPCCKRSPWRAGPLTTSSMNGSRLLRKGPSGYTDIHIELNKMLKGQEDDVQLQAEDILLCPLQCHEIRVRPNLTRYVGRGQRRDKLSNLQRLLNTKARWKTPAPSTILLEKSPRKITSRRIVIQTTRLQSPSSRRPNRDHSKLTEFLNLIVEW